MKLITLALFTVVLYGSDTCYTVQLLSTNSSKNNTKMLEGREYPDECKLMEIGSTLTVRCGCFEKIDTAQKELPKFKNTYKEAVVASTYKYRFDDVAKNDIIKNDVAKNDTIKSDTAKSSAAEVHKKTEIITVLPSHEEVLKDEDVPESKKEVTSPEALPATEPSQEDNEKDKKEKKKKKDKVKNIAVEEKIKKEEEERKIKEEEEKKKEEDNEKNKKDNKKDKKKKDKVKNKVEDKTKKEEEERKRKEEEEKKRKEEEEKKKKEEEDRRKREGLSYVKKRDADFSYERYLKPLKSTSGKKPFDYRYEFGGQFAYDVAYINEADASYHETDWRRVRLYHKGSFFNKKLFYEVEYSPIGDSKYKDMFAGYQNSLKPLSTDYRVKLGNLKVPFSLEGYTSSKYITFMERSLNDAFEESRKLGVELLSSTHLGGSYINVFGSAFSNSIDERINDEISTPGYSGRLTYAHEFSKNHLFSFGGGFMSQDIGDESIRFKQGSESEWIAQKYVSVKVKNVDTVQKRNVEALYINNSFSLQGEYATALVDSADGNYAFDAYYMQGSYFIIGNGREYKFGTSTLSKIKPNRGGALELAFRYSKLNLNDKDEHGGSQIDYNYGLNWYISDELRVMLNYVVAQPKETDDYDGLLQIIQGRVLFAF